jgi:transposase
MYLTKSRNAKTGRTYLSIVEGYRDQNKKIKHKTIQKVGYLDELQKTMNDPIAYYTAVADKLTMESKAAKTLNIRVGPNERVTEGDTDFKNYGYIALSRVYHELELDRFFDNQRRHEKFEYNSESIMRLLTYARVIYPDSKRQTLELAGRFFENFNFSLDDIYNSLTHFGKCAKAAQLHIHEQIASQYGRDTSLVYYDVTNYYYETEKQDKLRRKGVCKEHRPDPIIQMGLAIDSNGIPMAYKTYAGNTNDSETYIPSLAQIKKAFAIGRVIVVADKGLNCGDNIVFSSALGDGYVFSQSVLSADAGLKEYLMDQRGYSRPTAEGFKSKSRVIPKDVRISNGSTKGGNKARKTIHLEAQKQVVFYSPKYAERTKRKREETLKKAGELVRNPAKYTRATHYGAAAYVKNLEMDKDTGEILKLSKKLSIDQTKVDEEARYDGYYAIITSEIEESDERIIEMYHGLWRIEETFRITKAVLKTRPIFVYKPEHIDGHFLVCFIALILLRLVELRLERRFPAEKIAEVLRAVTCTYLEQGQYHFHYADTVTDAMNEAFGIDIGRKYMSLGEIKKSLAETKKKTAVAADGTGSAESSKKF